MNVDANDIISALAGKITQLEIDIAVKQAQINTLEKQLSALGAHQQEDGE